MSNFKDIDPDTTIHSVEDAQALDFETMKKSDIKTVKEALLTLSSTPDALKQYKINDYETVDEAIRQGEKKIKQQWAIVNKLQSHLSYPDAAIKMAATKILVECFKEIRETLEGIEDAKNYILDNIPSEDDDSDEEANEIVQKKLKGNTSVVIFPTKEICQKILTENSLFQKPREEIKAPSLSSIRSYKPQ